MLNKNDKIEIIKTGLILFLITALSAGLLAVVNAKTAPIIEKNELLKEQAAMQLVLPDAEGFEAENLANGKMDKIVSAVYKSKNNAGYVVMTSPVGYGGEISMAVGVTSDGKVSGVKVISNSETAGLGAKCTDSEWIGQFTGKTDGITVAKGNAKDNQINAISSATITSKAVTAGVNSAISAAAIAKEE